MWLIPNKFQRKIALVFITFCVQLTIVVVETATLRSACRATPHLSHIQTALVLVPSFSLQYTKFPIFAGWKPKDLLTSAPSSLSIGTAKCSAPKLASSWTPRFMLLCFGMLPCLAAIVVLTEKSMKDSCS